MRWRCELRADMARHHAKAKHGHPKPPAAKANPGSCDGHQWSHSGDCAPLHEKAAFATTVQAVQFSALPQAAPDAEW